LHITEAEVWKILYEYRMPSGFDAIEGAKNKVSAMETDIYMLGQLLRDSDLQSMWHSVELRVPFLDIDLANFVYQLPEEIKYPQGKHKFLLTEAFKDLLPESIVNRKKQGFTFPFESWMGHLEALNNRWLVPPKFARLFAKHRMSYSRLWAIYLTNAYRVSKEQLPAANSANPRTLFIYLSAFGKMGGIEKVNRTDCAGPAKRWSASDGCDGLWIT